MYLTILEISQKQAYIFESNKLRDNIINSAVIAWVMSAEYFEEKVAEHNANTIFSKEKNIVYSGGGHTVLEFETKEQAHTFVKLITASIQKEYAGLEVFSKTEKYDNKLPAGENLKNLTKALEQKKSKRVSAFHQGSFGVEKIDSKTLKPTLSEKPPCEGVMPKVEEVLDEKLSASAYGYERVWKFEDLGGSKDISNFIAVVHIDGNAMGKRLEQLYQKNKACSWEAYKKKLKRFSDSIDCDFKSAYQDMVEVVVKNLQSKNLDDLSIKENKFPVRRIITAGDDICFVTEGRIGLECAIAFLKSLSAKQNAEDKLGYSACAGVAIVHQKYPFYRAYELAEQLCTNAKKFGATLHTERGGEISSIDWHIEYGEMADTLEEIRAFYKTADEKQLELRPYMVCAPKELAEQEKIRQYSHFKQLITNIQNNELEYSKGRLKELRSILKQGETATQYYMRFHKIEDIARDSYHGIFKEVDFSGIGSGKRLERKLFAETSDKKQHSLLFDAIEMVDTFISLEY